MSEMSVLSNQYERLVLTTNNVNDSVILLKKKKFSNEDLTNKKNISKAGDESDILNNAKSSLISFLNSLLELLKNDVDKSEYVPNMVLEDYKNKLHTIPYIEIDVEKAIRLIKNNDNLPQESLDLLIIFLQF